MSARCNNPFCESCEEPIPDGEGHLTSDDCWLCNDCYREACKEHCPDEGESEDE